MIQQNVLSLLLSAISSESVFSAGLNTYCLTLLHTNDLEIDNSHDSGLKLRNLIVVLNT